MSDRLRKELWPVYVDWLIDHGGIEPSAPRAPPRDGPDRQRPLRPGDILGGRYVVEECCYLAPRRTFYRAGPAEEQPGDQRLISARWDPETFEPWLACCRKELSRPRLIMPLEVFVQDDLLFSVYPQESLWPLKAVPAPSDRLSLYDLAWAMLENIAHLHLRGVRLATLEPVNLLYSGGLPDLCDPEVEAVLEGDVPARLQAAVLRSMCGILRRQSDLEGGALRDFLASFEEEEIPDIGRFARGLEPLLLDYPVQSCPPRAALSHPSLRARANQARWDWVRLSDRASLHALAINVFAHQPEANALGLKTLFEVARSRPAPETEEEASALLDEAFQVVNQVLLEGRSHHDLREISLISLLLLDRVGFVANVGEARGYVLRGDVLHLLTRDHTRIQELRDGRRITVEEARVFISYRHWLTRTLGAMAELETDLYRIDLEPGDRLMLSSPGLHEEVEAQALQEALGVASPRDAALALCRAAWEADSPRGITLLLVDVPGSPEVDAPEAG